MKKKWTTSCVALCYVVASFAALKTFNHRSTYILSHPFHPGKSGCAAVLPLRCVSTSAKLPQMRKTLSYPFEVCEDGSDLHKIRLAKGCLGQLRA